MATSTTIGFTPKNSVLSEGPSSIPQLKKFEIVIDTAAANANGVNLGTDEYELFDVPEGHLHLSTVSEVLVAEGGTCTATIGITGALTVFVAAGLDLNAAAGTIFTDVDAGHAIGGATGGYVTPDGGVTVLLDPQNAMDAGKFRVTQLWVDMRGQGTTGFANQL